ncbi:hypothetical protein D3C75_832600 [compost metagenome]
MRTTRQELCVVPAVSHQRMRDTQHQRHISPHIRGNPLGIFAEEIHRFRAHRVNGDHRFAAVFQLLEKLHALFVTGVPRNLQRVERISAPEHHHVAMFKH